MKPRVRQRKLRREALVLIPLAVAAVKFIPARRILDWAAAPLQTVKRFTDPDLPALVAGAVEVRAAWFNLKAPCLPTALVAQWMLRRRGVPSRLCLGVRRDQSTLAAHAWLEINGDVVFGASDKVYTPVASYGT
jgi:hypothetical protein